MENNEIHYLSDEVTEILVPASVGKRFLNFIIDYIFMYALLFIGTIALLSLGLFHPISNKGGGDIQFMFLLFWWFFYVGVMFGLETILKGKSIGKLITRTRAVNEADGSRISIKTALLRSIIRTVPFEPFTAFSSYPWHDKWTNTMVVND